MNKQEQDKYDQLKKEVFKAFKGELTQEEEGLMESVNWFHPPDLPIKLEK